MAVRADRVQGDEAAIRSDAVQPFLVKGLYGGLILVVLRVINTAISTRLMAHWIRTHLLDLCPAEEKVGLGHQHLIVHVLNRRPVAFVTGNTHIQVDGRDILGL
jgi:hypothetical protein